MPDCRLSIIIKTGRLLSLPLVCAALLAGHREDAAVWERIGADTGLSFQIQDDILDVTSTVEELGKNINSDAENGKNNLCHADGR